MISEVTIVLLVHGLTALGGVYVGYRIAMRCLDMDLKYGEPHEDDWKVKEEDIPDSLIDRIFGKKPESEVPRVQTMEERYDSEKRHAFFDD